MRTQYLTYDPNNNPSDLTALATLTVRKKTDNGRTKTNQIPSEASLRAVSDDLRQNIEDIKAILELQPELRRGIKVFESAVLSPKDLGDPKITISLANSDNSAEAAEFLRTLTTYLKENHDIDPMLPEILHDSLHRTGSYALGFIPRGALDAIINAPELATESLRERSGTLPGIATDKTIEPWGLLGTRENEKTVYLGTEGYTRFGVPDREKESKSILAKLIKVTDNPGVLLSPMVNDFKRTFHARSIASKRMLGMENRKETLGKDIKRALYQARKNFSSRMISVPTIDKVGTTSGAPLVCHFPSTSVIPAFLSGNTSKHIGYFIALDAYGSPVTESEGLSVYDRTKTGSLLRDTDDEASNLLYSSLQQHSSKADKKNIHNKVNLEIFADIVERDLVDRLKNGIAGEEVAISTNQTLYKIMFERTLTNLSTRILYMPVDNLAYYAFEYDATGCGRSRLLDTRTIAAIRSTLLVANSHAAVTNAIGEINLGIELDEHDPDPDSTLEEVITATTKSRLHTIGIGTSQQPEDITQRISRRGMRLEVSGHPGYPDTKVNIEDTGRDVRRIDEDFDRDLLKRELMHLGLSPEVVDTTMDVDFAASIHSSNLLTAKITRDTQTMFLPQVTSHIQKYINNDGDAIVLLTETVKEFMKGKSEEEVEDFVFECLSNIKVSLPSPESGTHTAQVEALETYIGFIDTALESTFSIEMIEGLSDSEAVDAIDSFIAIIKSTLIRNYMRRENMLPELLELLDDSSKDSVLADTMDVQKESINGLMELIGKTVRHVSKEGRKQDRKNEEAIAEEEAELERQRQEAEAEAEADTVDLDNTEEDTASVDDADPETVAGTEDDTGTTDDLGDDLGGDEPTEEPTETTEPTTNDEDTANLPADDAGFDGLDSLDI